MIVVKPGCRFVFVPATLKMIEALVSLDRARLPGQPDTIVITAGCNGNHLPASKHYLGEALDVRTHNMPTPVIDLFRAEWEKILGTEFTVRVHDAGSDNEHLHAQVRIGTRYAGSLTSPIAEEYRA